MRAIAFAAYGPAPVLTVEERLPPLPGPGQVRVRVAATSVNPADWRLRSGQLRRFVRLRLPFVPGYDVAGVVDRVGPGTSGVAAGDAVLALQPTKVAGAYASRCSSTPAARRPPPQVCRWVTRRHSRCAA